MPNWTQNLVTVTGDENDVKAFRRFVSTGVYEKTHHDFEGKLEEFEDGFSFQKILPCPGLLFQSTSPTREETRAIADACMDIYGSYNWYDWCNKHWGTKWDASNVEYMPIEEGSVQYRFNTAWCAPQGIAVALRRLFPDLEIEWEALNEEDVQWREEDGEYVEELDWDDQDERYCI